MNKIYIAGASVEREVVKQYIERARALGYEITLDWTESVEACAKRGIRDTDLSRTERAEFAAGDRDAVFAADVVWLIVPKDPKSSIGCWVEFGMAIAWVDSLVITSGVDASIFCELANHQFPTHEAAFAFLTRRIGK